MKPTRTTCPACKRETADVTDGLVECAECPVHFAYDGRQWRRVETAPDGTETRRPV